MEQIYYKWTQLGGFCWSQQQIQVGYRLRDLNWAITAQSPGDGFGFGICSNPVEALEYLPPSIYKELYIVEPSDELVEVRPGFWRAESVFARRLVPKEEWPTLSTDKFILATQPDEWVEVGQGQRAFAVSEGRIYATGGIVRAYDESCVYATSKAHVECFGESTVLGLSKALLIGRSKSDLIPYDKARSIQI